MQKTYNLQNNSEKEDGGFILLYFKIYYIAIVTKQHDIAESTDISINATK